MGFALDWIELYVCVTLIDIWICILMGANSWLWQTVFAGMVMC